MGEEQQFCLRWNNFQANITSQFETLRDEEDFVDITLACEGQRIKAHKVVLSACSPYFKELFRSNPCKHPILFMRDVEFCHLQSLIEFMYAGEVNVAQAHLSSFLRTAESLQIRGLTEAPLRHKQDSVTKAETSPIANSLIQQLVSPGPQSISPRASSQPHTTSSPEVEEDVDDDVLSLSSSLSPPPPKRAREEEDNASRLSATTSQPTDSLQEIEPTFNKDDSTEPEIFEPKVEVPDYISDGEIESKGTYLGLESSLSDNPFGTLHGNMDLLAGPSTSQTFTGDPTSQEAALGTNNLMDVCEKVPWIVPRPCPVCKRVYSNNSNLRRHMKSAHIEPQQLHRSQHQTTYRYDNGLHIGLNVTERLRH